MINTTHSPEYGIKLTSDQGRSRRSGWSGFASDADLLRPVFLYPKFQKRSCINLGVNEWGPGLYQQSQ